MSSATSKSLLFAYNPVQIQLDNSRWAQTHGEPLGASVSMVQAASYVHSRDFQMI